MSKLPPPPLSSASLRPTHSPTVRGRGSIPFKLPLPPPVSSGRGTIHSKLPIPPPVSSGQTTIHAKLPVPPPILSGREATPPDMASWLQSLTPEQLAHLPNLILQETDRRFQEMFIQHVGDLKPGQHIWIDRATETTFPIPSHVTRMECDLSVELESTTPSISNAIVVDTTNDGLSAHLFQMDALAGVNRAHRAGRLRLEIEGWTQRGDTWVAVTRVPIAIYYSAAVPGRVYDPTTNTIFTWSGATTDAALMSI